MKHKLSNIVICTALITNLCYAADSEYISLEQVTTYTDEKEYPPRSIQNLYKEGVRTTNQVLNCSKRNLTTVVDLAQYRQTFDLANLASLNINGNHIENNDLVTILKNVVNLTFLDASKNKRITTIQYIPTHEKLETLLLNDNGITELDVHDLCTKLTALRQCALQNNPLDSSTITNITGTHPHMEEFWLGDVALTRTKTDAFIKTFPNIKAEFTAGSREVQRYYSETKEQYDKFDYCSCLAGCNRRIFWQGCSFISATIGGAIVGLAIAGILMEVQNPQTIKNPNDLIKVNNHWEPSKDAYEAQEAHRRSVLGINCAIYIPPLTVIPPLLVRLGYRVYSYCKTKPEDRYKTIHTREIAVQPQLLDLIEDAVGPTPDQEQEQEQGV